MIQEIIHEDDNFEVTIKNFFVVACIEEMQSHLNTLFYLVTLEPKGCEVYFLLLNFLLIHQSFQGRWFED